MGELNNIYTGMCYNPLICLHDLYQGLKTNHSKWSTVFQAHHFKGRSVHSAVMSSTLIQFLLHIRTKKDSIRVENQGQRSDTEQALNR